MTVDRPARNESELKAREKIVTLCRAMLAGDLSFFEGALQVCPLRFEAGVPEDDPDMTAFVVIQSETDHLPPRHIQHRWSPQALLALQPEFDKTEIWAKPFASKSCVNLIQRFSHQ